MEKFRKTVYEKYAAITTQKGTFCLKAFQTMCKDLDSPTVIAYMQQIKSFGYKGGAILGSSEMLSHNSTASIPKLKLENTVGLNWLTGALMP